MFRHTDLDLDKMTSNILSYLDIGNQQDINAGKIWYQQTSDLARQWADHYGLSLEQIAGLIAVFSIDSTWTINKRDVLTYLQSDGQAIVGRYAMVRNKAAAIYAGQDIPTVLGNRKIYCFWLNICKPREETRITIDRHAGTIAIAPGKTSINRNYYNTPAKYRKFEIAYNLAGKIANYAGQDIQAITWIIHRRLFVK